MSESPYIFFRTFEYPFRKRIFRCPEKSIWQFGHIIGHFKYPFFLHTNPDIFLQKTDIKNVRSGHSTWKVQINSKYATPDIRADIRGPKTDIKMSGCGHSECPDLLGRKENTIEVFAISTPLSIL